MREPLPLTRWTQVEALFLKAAELPPGERELWLDAECGTDLPLRDEILSLLRYDSEVTRGESGLLDAIQANAASLFDEGAIAGRLLGTYRIESELGRGGMAVVYLASRADGEFQKRVAIKLIKRGMDTATVVERLRRERRILAALDHPGIARLLDGGTTSEGLPYIVMEYVEGLPIGRYCEQNALGIAERCALFGKVCEAVAYAHRNLIIHRDLKPSNILVSRDGNPKLLDFGIATLLSGEADGNDDPLTRGPARPLTPEYASPEQLRGMPVGTATDVYSLGVVLFELLTGIRPAPFAERASASAVRTGKGWRWSRRLEGDLDTVLQMALRSEPERRYLSVEQLQADLRRHLEGMPVTARQESMLYRCGKFLGRHRLSAVAALLLALSMVGGLATTLWQARRAEAESQLAEARRVDAERERGIAQEQARQSAAARHRAESEHSEAELQRVAADTERQLADKRFEQVRQLAGKFLLDFHDAIAPLAGSTPARKMVVETGIRYYDSLVREAGGNQGLLEEIARGYDRLGDVQGNVYYPNLGDVEGAEASYKKALAVRQKVSDPSPQFLSERLNGYVKLSQARIGKGDEAGARGYAEQAVALGQGLGSESPLVRNALAFAWSMVGDANLGVGRNGDAIAAYTKLLALRLELAPGTSDLVTAQRNISTAQSKLGDVYFRSDRPAEALEHLKIALDIDRRLAADAPDNMAFTRKLKVTTLIVGNVLKSRTGQSLGRPGEATEYLQAASDLAAKISAADPDNRQALRDVADTGTALGDWLHDQKDLQGALAAWEKGMAAARHLAELSAGNGNDGVLSQLYRRMAIAMTDAGRYDDAMQNLQKAEQYAESVEKANPDSAMKIIRTTEITSTRTDIFVAQKRWRDAIDALTKNISDYQRLAQLDPANQMMLNDQPAMYTQLADCYAALNQPVEAARSLDTALELLRTIESRRPLSPDEEEMRKDSLAKLSLWTH